MNRPYLTIAYALGRTAANGKRVITRGVLTGASDPKGLVTQARASKMLRVGDHELPDCTWCMTWSWKAQWCASKLPDPMPGSGMQESECPSE